MQIHMQTLLFFLYHFNHSTSQIVSYSPFESTLLLLCDDMIRNTQYKIDFIAAVQSLNCVVHI